MNRIKLLAFVALLFAGVGCGDAEDKADPEILCEEEDGVLVADRCPGTTTCWKGNVGAGPYECVDQCSPGSCDSGEICTGGAFSPPTCTTVPECDLEASQENCADGCIYDSQADQVQIDGEMCTLVAENVGACVTPNFQECLNSCPNPTEVIDLPDGTSLLVTTQTGTLDATSTQPPDSCYEL